MAVPARVLGFFLSLRTAIWLLLALIAFFLIGAVVMPIRDEYESMNRLPLFFWLLRSPAGATWWLWGSIGALALLTANTVLCSVESVIRKRKSRQWLLIISPQIIHVGFALIVLAHLLSAMGAAKGDVMAGKGASIMLPNNTVLKIKDIKVRPGPGGYPADWRAEVEYRSGGVALRQDFLAPNRPSFFRGLGVYMKDVRRGVALIEVSREPGAPWALAGGSLFTLGTVMLFFLKIRRER
jgi:hypothetical protein